jgi:hypothetical protein
VLQFAPLKGALHMSKRIVVATLIALPLLSCSPSWSADLTRPQAKAILSKTKTFTSTYNQLSFVDNGFQQFAALGGANNPEFAKVFTVATPGTIFNIGNAAANTITVRTPLPARVDEITGIADAGQGMKEVLFHWSMVNVPDVLKPFVAVGGTGRAVMRLYDDGWRVENGPSLSNDTTPPTLTAPQKAQLDRLREAERNRLRETAAKAQSAETLRLEKIAASKKPTQTLYRFKSQIFFAVWPANPKKTAVVVEVTDTNVNVKVDEGHNVTIWFACMAKGTVSHSTGWYREESKYLLHIGHTYCETHDEQSVWIEKGMRAADSLNFDDQEEAEKANVEIEKAHQAWLVRYGDVKK